MSLIMNNRHYIQEMTTSIANGIQESSMRYALECQRMFELESQQTAIMDMAKSLVLELEMAGKAAGFDLEAIKQTTPEEVNFVIGYINKKCNCNAKEIREAYRKLFQHAGLSEKASRYFVTYIEVTATDIYGTNPFEY